MRSGPAPATTVWRVRLLRSTLPAAMLGSAALGAGCAGMPRPPVEVEVPPGEYAAAFDAARAALVACRFELDRVDARAGVITTQPKTTAGLATPWDIEQSSQAQEWEDLLNVQQRRVRIEFLPAGTDEPGDMTAYDGTVTARIRPVIERGQRPGQRVEPTAIGRSTLWRAPSDPALAGSFTTPVGEDRLLAQRLAAGIRSAWEEGR
jgi:hypothetical protein